jgi:nucleoside 2-deoxyribosyltransferase
MSKSMPRLYLAGPEVFLRNAVEIGEAKKAICRRYGAEGVFPLDAALDLSGMSGEEAGMRISAANEALIRSSDAIVANMTPFRGISADVGTVYEMGFGAGLGHRVFAYSNVSTGLTERTLRELRHSGERGSDGRLEDAHGMQIEEFGLRDNLMLEGGIRISGGEMVLSEAREDRIYTDLKAFEECVARAAGKLRSEAIEV